MEPARGGVEFGAGHYPAMVVLHTGLLAGCLVEAMSHRPFIRRWAGRCWSSCWPHRRCAGGASPRWAASGTPGSSSCPTPARVTGGPYRLVLPHPNYVAVVVEGIALPLVHSAWVTAVVFTVLNAALLRIRIGVENAALARLT